MEYQLGLYEKALPSELSFRQKLQIAKESGFDWLEISIDESPEKQKRLYWNKEQVSDLKHAIDETGVPILTMCLSGHRKYPFGSHDLTVRQKSLDIMEKAIELASDLGVRIIQLAGYDVYYETSDETKRTARSFLRSYRWCPSFPS
ncbi:MAG: TIM barrel protein, partial [Sphaerochaetaceae bacterium]